MNVGSYCSWAISGLIALATNGAAQAAETNPVRSLRALYAVNQATGIRGSIAVYDIDTGHRLLKTIQTVPEIHNIKGEAPPNWWTPLLSSEKSGKVSNGPGTASIHR
jgi:hypothetical protein